jgi:hypothetical protein
MQKQAVNEMKEKDMSILLEQYYRFVGIPNSKKRKINIYNAAKKQISKMLGNRKNDR